MSISFGLFSFMIYFDVNQLTRLVDVKMVIWIHFIYYHDNPIDVNSLPETDH